MLSFFADLLFPKRCVGCKKIGSYLCDNCFSNVELYQQYVCPMCLKRSAIGETHPSCITTLGIDGIACGVVYKGAVKKLLYRFKYPPYLSDLASTIGKLFTETVNQQELFVSLLSSHPIVAEVPLSSEKHRRRGYNQAEILARILAHEFKLSYKTKILERIKNTNSNLEKQKVKNKETFQMNVKNKKIVNSKTVLLVDDLVSSCATLRECAKVLKQNGAKRVYGVTFAREI